MIEQDANNLLGMIKASDEKIDRLTLAVARYQAALLVVQDMANRDLLTINIREYVNKFNKKNHIKWGVSVDASKKV